MNNLTQAEERAIARVLDQRFGDGLVYLRTRADKSVLHHALVLGLVDEEGYLTALGRRFWRQQT